MAESQHEVDRVLAVDDNIGYREMLADALSDHGHIVLQVDSGEEALALLRAGEPIDAVLLDLQMPGMSGYDVTREIRRDPALRTLPILLLTGHNDRHVMVEGLEAGADDFVAKDADLSILRSRLRAHLRRKRMEDENRSIREQRDRAEQDSFQKSDFLARMSHEIRTPMNAVVGMTSLLLDTKLTPEQRSYVETIRSSGDHLLVVINDILDFSKVEAGLLVIESYAFDLFACVEEALDLVAQAACDKDLELAYVPDGEVPRMISGDGSRVRQVLLNLLSNAVKFTQEGEVTVILSAKPLPDGQVIVRFAVRDTGIGISTETQARLFSAFSQADTSTTRVYGGTGLGLSISKKLAQLMGGDIAVTSTAGSGSTFELWITASRSREVAPIEVEQAFAGRRVLLVDDNATNLTILEQQTRNWGLEARSTRSAHEALDWIRRGDPFEIAVLDYRMPELDGIELARSIRAERAALPIVLVSSYGRPIESYADAGIAAFLSKPVRRSTLRGVLASVLGGATSGVPEARTSMFDPTMATRLPLRILIAEDNPVNQRVATSMLGKLGYRADVVGNGQEAVDAVKRQRYDLVLMDLHMPVMDGLDATRSLGQLFAQHDRPRVVAMTAAALEDERRRCFDAGMDDYLAKPITLEKLVAMLERTPRDDDSSIELALEPIIEQLGNALAADIVQTYLDDAANLLVRIEKGVETQDVRAVAEAAHQIKATSATVGALSVEAPARALEEAGRNGTLDGASAAALVEAFRRVKPVLVARCETLLRRS